jgi:hypothetical protein
MESALPPTPVVVPQESVQAEAAISGSGSGGVGSVVAETSGGLTINLEFDAAAMAAPASFRAGIEQAAAILSSAISDKITLNFQIDYSGTGGGAAAGPDYGQWLSYSTVRADLVNNASPGDTTFNALPTGSTIQGQSSVAVWNAQLKLWSFINPNDATTVDGSATFATDINPSLLVGVALHELTHAMGRVPYGSQPDIFDFYRFTSVGARLFTDSIPASAAYFSIDGGSTKLADYGQNSDPSDFLNSGVQGANDPFNEYYTGSTLQHLTAIDLNQLDALGFHLTSAVTPMAIEAYGSTSLVQVGANYFLDPVAGGSGPALKLGGALITAGQFSGGWTPIGGEATASGYEVAWKVTGADEYTVWKFDSSGNFVSAATGVVSGSSYTLESLEPSFHQDLNGDGVIGIHGTTIEAYGSTSLIQIGSNYVLIPVGGGTGPELKLGGALITAGQFGGGWTPIGGEATASGYEVAWKVTGADEYTVWNFDSSGNFVSAATGVVSGSSYALESLESSFHQDLNGDGVIGIPSATGPASAQTSVAPSGQSTFDGTTLTLAQPSTFSGLLIGFTGNGTQGSDQIDLRGFDFNMVHSSFDSSSNTLSVSDGSAMAALHFLEGHSQNSFHFVDDSNGGTLIVAAASPGQTAGANEISNLAAQDTFVFAPNYGQVTLANFAPATDTLQFSKSVFADVAALLVATHDDPSGNAVITDAAQDTITLQHITTAQLLTHQSDLHVV